MQFISRLFADAVNSISVCCPPLTACILGDEQPHRDFEKSAMPPHGQYSRRQPTEPYVQTSALPDYSNVAGLHGFQYEQYGQPGRNAPAPARPATRGSTKQEKPPRKSISLSIRSFSVRKHRRTTSGGRPHISAPTNFRHIYHQTVDMPLEQPRRAPQPRGPRPLSRFRPLELSIYLSQQQLSPLLPHFTSEFESISPPPPAHTRDLHSLDDAHTLVHERSYSSMSFHLPRRGTSDNLSTSGSDNVAPSPPPKSKARMRATTLERIASAILEKEKIQEQIDNVVERQSIYSVSRPSTPYGMHDLEPMPSIPALPPAEGLTFAERVSTPAPLALERPRTAPPPKVTTPTNLSMSMQMARARSPTEISLPHATHHRTVATRTPPPPLPLVLRPPLRKKKSFSRVSSWLFPGQEQTHQRHFSRDSVTNLPRPVKETEGFYQCVAPAATGNRPSFDSVLSASSWSTEADEVPTAASTWSPQASSPSSNRTTTKPGSSRSAVPQRVGTFGSGTGHRRESVGVAF